MTLFRRKSRPDHAKEAEDIVHAYAAVLARHDEFALFPESMLPHSKEDIKAALVTAMFFAKEHELGLLVGGYMMLADFVPDEEAQRINEFWAKWENKEDIFASQESKLEFYKDEDKATFFETLKKANEDSLRLAAEAKEYVRKMRPLKSGAQ